MADDSNTQLSASMKQLRQHLLTIENVLASMNDIHSDARNSHRRGLQDTLDGMVPDTASSPQAKRKQKDNFLGLSQRQIWSQFASAISSAIKRGL